MHRLTKRITLLLAAAVLTACGEGYFAVGSDGFYYEGGYYYDYRYEYRRDNCRAYEYPAVIVEFFAAEDGGRIAVDAEGDLISSRGTERLRPERRTASGLVTSLLGGYDRIGVFDVVVSARRPGDRVDQTFTFRDVVVSEDRCGTVTEFLRATID